jgi:S-adenosylmethionine:tRNA ribosyltransferase-isomerase
MIDASHHINAYDYDLPTEQIAQFPATERDQSRLLVLEQDSPTLGHRNFADIVNYLRPDDLLLINTSKVFPARLLGQKASGGKVEIFLLGFPHSISPANSPNPSNTSWQEATALALIKSSKRPKVGSLLFFGEQIRARVDTLHTDGKADITLQYLPESEQTLETLLEAQGQMPLPPYINRPQGGLRDDLDRYQTRYARQLGSVAAPTAGLHFSDALLARIRNQGVDIAEIVLHVGYGTFAPVRVHNIREHAIHTERVEIAPETADAIHRTQTRGGRIWAVGTTTVRAIEFATDAAGRVRPGSWDCNLFIYPGYQFRTVENLITNFHLPKSSLLFLVSALAGRERILAAYQEAVATGYRFFSYGDAMAIITKP